MKSEDIMYLAIMIALIGAWLFSLWHGGDR